MACTAAACTGVDICLLGSALDTERPLWKPVALGTGIGTGRARGPRLRNGNPSRSLLLTPTGCMRTESGGDGYACAAPFGVRALGGWSCVESSTHASQADSGGSAGVALVLGVYAFGTLTSLARVGGSRYSLSTSMLFLSRSTSGVSIFASSLHGEGSGALDASAGTRVRRFSGGLRGGGGGVGDEREVLSSFSMSDV